MGSEIKDQPDPKAQPQLTPTWDLVVHDIKVMFDGRLVGKPEAFDAVDEVKRLVVEDMRERDRVGRERYGTPLTPNNGRDHLVDAYQEALDCAVYLRNELAEREEKHKHASAVHSLYLEIMETVMNLRWAIHHRWDGLPMGAVE